VNRSRRQELLQKWERYTEIPLLALSVAIIPLLLGPFFFELNEDLDRAFLAADWTIWAIFAIDISARTYLAEHRLAYLRRNWFDVLIVVLPFLRPLRVLRSLRAIRLLRAGPFLIRVFASSRDMLRHRGLQWVLLLGLAIIFACATIVWGLERDSGGTIDDYGTALWWAFSTVTTVGYGDATPVTTEGRAVAIFLMLVGISFFGWITANIAAFLVEFGGGEEEDEITLRDVMARLDRIEQQIQALREQPGQRGGPV
jgi:voltage-gated potassium channel